LKKKESNFGKKNGKVGKKIQKKRGRNALWITVVIHSTLCVGGTMIPPHHLDYC